ncbi:TetR/AcrR family transcriptional regulator [Alkalihalobacillus sp. TS-13]|uniref:TetR/AcrR family transcriptional regulator n=1 Tax=Alkalihalobacillus sp. TS-13 TaxID=2842455 RepID=UPI001C86EB99|nr:TetR/AcrR family transcriptional regulator [Alkalihalobacillus sp. TS-13]
METYNHDKRFKKGEKTRLHILNSAVELIASNGLRSLSTAKLAKASRVSKSTIFHHFNSSEEVLMAALNLVFEEMQKLNRKETYMNVEDFLQTLGDSMFQTPEPSLTFFKAFLSFSHESLFNPAYRDIIISFVDQMERFFYIELSKLVPSTIDPAKVKTAATLILPIMDGIGYHYLLNNDVEKYRKIWFIQINSIVQMLNPS